MATIKDDFLSIGITPSWTLLRMGWEGLGKDKRRFVSRGDIESFAYDAVSQADAKSAVHIAQLSDCATLSDENIGYLLGKLAREPAESDTLKWQVLLLSRILSEMKDMDSVKGLTALTEFWAIWDYPDYMPHIVQGRGNTIAGYDYFSEKHFHIIIDRHERWIFGCIKWKFSPPPSIASGSAGVPPKPQ